MIILDTTKDTQYKGHISKACEMLRLDECDEVITRGSDFVCLKYSNQEQGKQVRERMLKQLDNSEIRYIVTAHSLDDKTQVLYLSNQNSIQPDIRHAIFFKTLDEAQRVINTTHLKSGYSYAIEEYLYRLGKSCRLRIYHTIKGLKTDYGILQFIRLQIKNNCLTERYDANNKPYVWLDDLLAYKNKQITLYSASNIAYKRTFNLELLLHDGLIAFDAISSFVDKHPDNSVPEVRYLTVNTSGTARRKFYDLGAVFYKNLEIQKLAISELGLQEWV